MAKTEITLPSAKTVAEYSFDFIVALAALGLVGSIFIVDGVSLKDNLIGLALAFSAGWVTWKVMRRWVAFK